MLGYSAQCRELHVRYPRWRTRVSTVEPDSPIEVHRAFDDVSNGPECVFDTVFVCRSGSWAPPWCDDDFGTSAQVRRAR